MQIININFFLNSHLIKTNAGNAYRAKRLINGDDVVGNIKEASGYRSINGFNGINRL